MQRLAAALCLAAVPLIALATIYKVQMPDGSILFTDSPPAGGKVLEERESKSGPRPPAKSAPAAAPAPANGPGATDKPAIPVLASPPSRGPAGPGAPAAAAPTSLDAANAELATAERELAVARRKLELGREPMAGERLGTAKGGSRLSPEYEARIESLERDVSVAEDRVRRAYATRNALK